MGQSPALVPTYPPPRRLLAGLALLGALLGLLLAACGSASGSAGPPNVHQAATSPTTAPVTTTTAPVTTTTVPITTTTGPPTTAVALSRLPAPAPGFVPGLVTAVGDSVMIDYQDELQTDIQGVQVYAAVSRQWSEGEAILQQLKAEGQLGAVVIVALGTNGTLSSSDFDSMMSILSGASRVVFVNIHVDQPYQDANNAVLAAGVARYHHTVLADYASLAAANPGWYGPDGTHLAVDGAGTQQVAALIASKV